MISKFNDLGGSTIEVDYDGEFVTLSTETDAGFNGTNKASYQLDKEDLFAFVGLLLKLQKIMKEDSNG